MKKTEEEKNCGNCVSFPKEKIGNYYFCQNRDSPMQPNPIGKECYCHLHRLQVKKEEMALYDWQKKAIAKYHGVGIIKTVTGAGKSLAGKKIAEKIGGNIVISAPKVSILDQWKIIMSDFKNVQFKTFQTLCKEQISDIDLLIVDEVHRSISPEYIKLYQNVKYKNILGLSATPTDKCIEMCGETICDVGFDEANVSPFIVTFHGIELTFTEQQEYHRYSYIIRKLMQEGTLTAKQKDDLNAVIMKRRDIVYKARKRLPYVVNLIKEEWSLGHKILVICQRISQVNEISKSLGIIPNIVYHSGQKDDLNLYRSGKVSVCISVGMLKEGFDDPDTDIGIIASTPLSESFNIQAIGRVIRYKPEKFAEVHIVLANNTSDSKVLSFSGNYDFKLKNIVLPNVPELVQGYYNGELYSFNFKDIWKKQGDGRIYMEPHPIIKELRKVKPAGGRFSVNETGVYTKIGKKIVKVSDEKVEFVPKAIKEEKSCRWEEIQDMWKPAGGK